jgi:3-oxoadipate enol-lactonase
MKAHSRYLQDRRGRLHYQTYGNGPCIVLCHALGTALDVWSDLVEPLSESFTVVNFDLRGHGRSAPATDEDYSFEAMAADVRRLLQQIGVQSTAVVGISVGGEVAQVFAAQYPELTRSLVLCSTACVTGEERAALWQRRIEEIEATGITSIASASVSRWFTQAFRTQHTATVEMFRTRVAEMDPRVYISMARTIQQMDLRPRIRGLSCPTLVICGDEDANTGPEAAWTLVENIPKAELSVVQGAAHFPNLEAPERFNPLVLEWLASQGLEASPVNPSEAHGARGSKGSIA